MTLIICDILQKQNDIMYTNWGGIMQRVLLVCLLVVLMIMGCSSNTDNDSTESYLEPPKGIQSNDDVSVESVMISDYADIQNGGTLLDVGAVYTLVGIDYNKLLVILDEKIIFYDRRKNEISREIELEVCGWYDHR